MAAVTRQVGTVWQTCLVLWSSLNEYQNLE